MPQHYGSEFETYEQQRRILERLRQQVPFQVEQAREFTNTYYGTKQGSPCDLISDADVVRLCRQGYTPGTYPPGQTYNPAGTYPGDGNGNGNGNGDGGGE